MVKLLEEPSLFFITRSFISQFILQISSIESLVPRVFIIKYVNIHTPHTHTIISGGPLTCCVNVRLLSGDKKNIAVNLFSKLGWELGLYYASYDDFQP